MKFRSIISILIIVMSSSYGFGQNPEKGSVMFSAGLFPGTIRDLFNASVESRYGTNRYWNIALDFYQPFSFGGSPPTSKSLSIGYGLSYISRIIRLSSSTGPAIIMGWDWGKEEYKLHPYTNFGFVGRGQIIITPIKEFGLGIEAIYSYDQAVIVKGIRPVLFFQRTI